VTRIATTPTGQEWPKHPYRHPGLPLCWAGTCTLLGWTFRAIVHAGAAAGRGCSAWLILDIADRFEESFTRGVTRGPQDILWVKHSAASRMNLLETYSSAHQAYAKTCGNLLLRQLAHGGAPIKRQRDSAGVGWNRDSSAEVIWPRPGGQLFFPRALTFLPHEAYPCINAWRVRLLSLYPPPQPKAIGFHFWRVATPPVTLIRICPRRAPAAHRVSRRKRAMSAFRTRSPGRLPVTQPTR